MTKSELIAALAEVPDDAEIQVLTRDGEWMSLSWVESLPSDNGVWYLL